MRLGSLHNTNAKLYSTLQMKWSSGPVRIWGVVYHNDEKAMVKENFESLVTKIDNTLSIWDTRDLSLIGRVLVVNSLIISQLVYKMLMMFTIQNEYFDRVQESIKTFLWQGKRPKIAYTKLIQDYSNGGLKLVDIACKNKAMKVSWDERIVRNDFLQNIVKHVYTLQEENIWQYNISVKDIRNWNLAKDIWYEIIYSWAEINYRYPENGAEMLAQGLW